MRARATRIVFSIVIILAIVTPVFGADSQVRETVLPNGLKVLTKEVHAVPVVSFNVWYRVGSRNEELGKTGLSHFLEHMQFKGTESLEKGEIDRLIQKNGGISNAATSKDYTYYWETLSSDKLELAMRIEADRMVNSLIDPEEFKAEMTVVRSELEGKDNVPDYLMYYELYSTAFKAHPYQWPTIGWVHDVEGLTRDDLYGFYKTYYQPNNATVVIVGDFDTDKAIEMVKKYFGKIPRGPEPPKVTAVEPKQFGERRAIVRKAGVAERLMMGYHIPATGDPDLYALDVAEIVLSTGTSSRLYKNLVDTQLATDAWAGSYVSTDPDLFVMGATARDGVKIADVEAALIAETEKLKTEPIIDEELQKALNQLEASFIYANDSVSAQARQLGAFETRYTWKYIDEYLPNVRKVTKADVQRVAQKYFTQENRTVVTFIPEKPEQPSVGSRILAKPVSGEVGYKPDARMPEGNAPATRLLAATATAVSQQDSSTSGPAEASSEVKPTRVVLDNGMVVIVYENHSNATVAVQGSLNAGAMLDPDGKSGLAQITADLLMKGTSSRTADQIAAEKDFHAMSLDTSAQTEYATFSSYSLSKDYDRALDLLSDVLRNPTFPEDELGKMKARKLSGIKQQQDSPEALAFRRFYSEVFPKGHPYHRLTVEESLANVSAITRQDVQDFYTKHYGPQSAVIVVVGDVDAQDAIARIKARFGDWKSTGKAAPITIADTPLGTGTEKKVISMPDKSQVDIVLGYPGQLRRSDPDFYSVVVMNFILGGGGALGSRLGDVIRDDMGLVYNVYTTFDASMGEGPWYAYLGTNPDNADKAVSILVEQMKLMRDKGATQEELDQAVDFIAGSFPARRLENSLSIAETLHGAEIYGLGMDYIQKYQQNYRSVTLEQVNSTAKKYLHPDKYTLVIAGSYQEQTK